MADQNFIDGLKTELGKLNDPELTALRNDVNELKARPVAPSPKAYITASWRNGTSWYKKFSDGRIEQGGIFTPTIENYNVPGSRVTLHTPFKTLDYSILCTQCHKGTNAVCNNATIFTGKISTSVITMAYWGDLGEPMAWTAYGY